MNEMHSLDLSYRFLADINLIYPQFWTPFFNHHSGIFCFCVKYGSEQFSFVSQGAEPREPHQTSSFTTDERRQTKNRIWLLISQLIKIASFIISVARNAPTRRRRIGDSPCDGRKQPRRRLGASPTTASPVSNAIWPMVALAPLVREI